MAHTSLLHNSQVNLQVWYIRPFYRKIINLGIWLVLLNQNTPFPILALDTTCLETERTGYGFEKYKILGDSAANAKKYAWCGNMEIKKRAVSFYFAITLFCFNTINWATLQNSICWCAVCVRYQYCNLALHDEIVMTLLVGLIGSRPTNKASNYWAMYDRFDWAYQLMKIHSHFWDITITHIDTSRQNWFSNLLTWLIFMPIS